MEGRMKGEQCAFDVAGDKHDNDCPSDMAAFAIT